MTSIAGRASRARRAWPLLLLSLPALAGGCATLPSSGPTANEIVRAQRLDRFDLFEIDEAVVAQLGAAPAPGKGRMAALAVPGDVDTIGPGDVLQISVYEVGTALFGGRSVQPDPAALPTGSGEALPPLTVGRDGTVLVPWVGRMSAQGKTPDMLAEELTRAYRRSSENPQVLVTIRENLNNTVIVQGDVAKPGRLPLTLTRERLLDAIAIAGGTGKPEGDSIVRLNRGDRTAEQPMSAIAPGSDDDLQLIPQDRISVLFRPRSFTVLGASGKTAEVPFAGARVSLAEAMGRAGGPNDDRADPSAVFVFRYEAADYDGVPTPGARPIAYRLNMRDPQSYFLAQRFEMRSRDVLYVANAQANIPTKAIQILNLFFSPFYTARMLTR